MSASRMARLCGPCLIFALVILGGCDARAALYKIIVGEQEKYMAAPGYEGDELTKLTERVYTFRWTWYRNIVIDTDAGLVLVDPFNKLAAAALKRRLAETFPGREIHTLIYTHYHLDHVSGGAELASPRIIAHEKCPEYWEDLPAERTAAVAKPTRLVKGDVDLKVGGVEIRMIYLGKTHTDTLYAIHLPGEKVLHTADFGLIRTWPPLGGPDYYIPGALKAYDRLLALDFDHYVPSHFGYGRKDDLREARDFMVFLRERCREAVAKYGKADGTGLPPAGEKMTAAFEYVYEPLKEKYGDWHGFDQMALMSIIRHVVGEGLGY